MNLLDRIERCLDDGRYRLQQLDFEDCATSLVSHEYPGLAPVPGGTDHGLDAELVRPNGQILGLITTSSRTWEGAKRSLRGSLESAREHGRTVQQVMVANLAEVNRQKRIKLGDIARDFDCELIQVYDRAWFANAFIANPEWRQKVLRIPGGAFSLSRVPRGARPDERQLPTVGRDELIASASSAAEDLVLWGVPGSGKSHVAGKLPGALFLEQGTPPERLLDDLLSTTPHLVIVDDAGARADDLERLLHARRAEHLTFRVAATCWPHEKDAVSDHLPGAQTFEVDLLPREEIGTLLRERGITRTSVLAHLLEQAQGRPAWALNLADLLVGQGDWQSVWTGQAVREQIRAFLRRSNAPTEAIHLLAAIALVGEANEDDARTLAGLFKLGPIQFDELVRSVAVAGLLDVRRLRMWRGRSHPSFEDSYRVVPRIIAGSIVADVYFAGRATPVRIRDIKAALPQATSGILQTQIHAALLGATEPLVPTTAELLEVLPEMTSTPEGDELLRTYALIGPECARFVFDYLEGTIKDAADSNSERSAISAATTLASRVAEALQGEDSEPTGTLFDALALVAARDWDYKKPIKTLVEDVQDARTGEVPTPTAILHLATAMGSQQAEKLPERVWLELAAQVLQPTFDGNYMSPEKANQFVMQSFTWPAGVMDELFDVLRVELSDRIKRAASSDDLEGLMGLMSKWAAVANGHGLPYGGTPSAGQRASAHRIAHSIASDLATQITPPGLRANFNKVASRLGITLDEPDELFAALTAERDFSEDREEDRRRRDTGLDEALARYLQEPPKVLMEWLVHHEADLAVAKNGTAGWQVMARLTQQSHPEVWLHAALDHGLGRMVSPLVSKCVDLGLMGLPMAARLLQDPGGRAALVVAVISACRDAHIVNLVINDLSVDDIQNLDSSYAIRHASDSTREALFTHPNPAIRSNAAALWAAEWSMDPDGMSEDPNWARAMSDLVVPSTSMRDYLQSEALKFFANSAPTAYMDLLVKHVEALEGRDDFDEWEGSVRELSGADRVELWRKVRDSSMAMNLFWVIAAGDADWITAAVADPEFPVPLSRLLHATRFQLGKRYSLGTLAVMLRPLKWQPDDLLWTLEVGTYFGEEHERLAQHVEVCRELAASSEADLARLGARGMEIYEPRMIEARAAARRAAVRGTLEY